MAYTFQLVVDCVDPHSLAAWWAETLGWNVEPQDADFIRSMVDQGLATEADTREVNGALVWRVGAAINAPAGEAPHIRILFQLVPEPKSVKNRLHLDIRAGGDDVTEVRRRLLERGATQLHTGQQGPYSWVTMADPEGNEFCVQYAEPPLRRWTRRPLRSPR